MGIALTSQPAGFMANCPGFRAVSASRPVATKAPEDTMCDPTALFGNATRCLARATAQFLPLKNRFPPGLRRYAVPFSAAWT